MNRNFKLIKCNQYLTDYCNELISSDNFHPNTKLFYASFLINSVIYDISHTNYSLEEENNSINNFKQEDIDKSNRENSWFNSEFPKLIPPKKRWGKTWNDTESK